MKWLWKSAAGVALLGAAAFAWLPETDSQVLASAQRDFRANCTERNAPTARVSRETLERYCECAAKGAVAELSADELRRVLDGRLDAVETFTINLKVAAAQSRCLIDLNGQRP